MKKYFLLSLCLLINAGILSAQVKLSPIFSDNMVLQQLTQAPVWGDAAPNKRVEVTTSWDRKKYTIHSDTQGKWSLKVQTPVAGGPYTIVISDGKPTTISNVFIGEVWLCSGQSNMEMQVEGWGKVNNYEQELTQANLYPNIRLLQVEKNTSPVPITDVKVTGGGWQVCSAASVANFSAVGYFFARDIHKFQNVPVGIINTSWGGTIAETWTSASALATMPSMKGEVQRVESMPQSKEQREKLFISQVEQWKKETQQKDLGFQDGRPVWASLQTDDSGWQEMKLPGVIQEQGLAGFNGLVWFRKSINIPANWVGKDLILNIGPVDDNDFTYFNGVEIGHTEGWMSPRSYKIPKELVKKGEAIISIRVMDTGGSGGMNGNPENLYLQATGKDRLELAGEWRYRVSLNINDFPKMPVNSANEPNIASFLFNAMLNPLIPYSIKGVLWYQGESNSGRAYQYRDLLPLMITDWRSRWGYEFPFYIVQLANFTVLQSAPTESTWAELREAQSQTLHLNNTGLAVAIDIGDESDIHPKNKQEVGRRLALAARAQTYGEKIAYSGPQFDTYTIEGDKIRIRFKHTDAGLTTYNNEPLKGFTIAGVDHKFYWAQGVIEGDEIVVSSPDVVFPIAVRYGWADNPLCNLVNGAALPASPFRTDDWQGITYGNQ